jgi:putative ATPase
MKDLGYGENYQYAHDYAGHFVNQQYLPDEIKGTRFWEPQSNVQEDRIKERMDALWGKKGN